MKTNTDTEKVQGTQTERQIGPMVIINQIGRLVKNLKQTQNIISKQDIETIRAIHTKAIQNYLNITENVLIPENNQKPEIQSHNKK